MFNEDESSNDCLAAETTMELTLGSRTVPELLHWQREYCDSDIC